MSPNFTAAISAQFCCPPRFDLPPGFDVNCITLTEPTAADLSVVCGNGICCPHFYPNGTVNMDGTICGTKVDGVTLTCQNGDLEIIGLPSSSSGSSAVARLSGENISIMTLITVTLLLLQLFQLQT
ncbi:hypothetical protein LIPSTDRAFT_73052 [Lipomyces starkeyi NRRL Y-11557]|uniref:Uncharacterized protein n=1 Tax=Lipomyces starkeyi NRRL Y-11557 TaxID=675824 RepID=A0A1E3Q3Q0_LIPST|nr:hypothetical protein LIPSTDRAFT_73052 [Lipomyces starkeyi NRRL Y-11557]